MAGAESQTQLAALMGTARLEHLQTELGPVETLKEAAGNPAESDLPGSIVIIEHDQPGAVELLEAYALRRPDAGVVLIGNDLDARAVRALFRFAQSEILSAPPLPSEIVEKVRELEQTRESEPASPKRGARFWAFRGAVGGAGATTLAIEAAFSLARGAGKARVGLIDLNISDGMSAAFLDGQAKLDLNAISADPARIDANLLRVYCWLHEKGIHLIAAPRNPDADRMVPAEAILGLLDTASSMFDWIVIDLPRHKLDWTDRVLAAVDDVFVVSELTVPSLHAAADMCRDTDRLRADASPAHLLLNRMFAKRRHRHSFPIEKAERAIQRRIEFTVSSDWDAARMAVNLGMPIAQVKPKSPIVQDMARLVSSVRDGEHAVPPARKAAGAS